MYSAFANTFKLRKSSRPGDDAGDDLDPNIADYSEAFLPFARGVYEIGAHAEEHAPAGRAAASR